MLQQKGTLSRLLDIAIYLLKIKNYFLGQCVGNLKYTKIFTASRQFQVRQLLDR